MPIAPAAGWTPRQDTSWARTPIPGIIGLLTPWTRAPLSPIGSLPGDQTTGPIRDGRPMTDRERFFAAFRDEPDLMCETFSRGSCRHLIQRLQNIRLNG